MKNKYQDARDYLSEVTKYGSVLGLDSIKELLIRLHNPQADLQFVHVAGTNGKGSTVAFISTILSKAGYKTGRYTSPGVFSYREIIQINEKTISKERFASFTLLVKEAADLMVKDGFTHPTLFEIETAIALLHFKEESCDIVVLETGLGGLLDATNIVENTLVAVLTSISLDHMEYLGDTIEKITYNKAGIIKPDSIVVTTKQAKEAMNVIEAKCKDNNKRIIADKLQASNIEYHEVSQSINYKQFKHLEIGLLGSYQIENAILSIEVALALREKGFDIKEEHIREGLKSAVWQGRFQTIHKNPLIIVDGAHNEAAALALRDTIIHHFANKKIMFVMGVFADKDYKKMIQIMAPLAERILTITIPNNKRALNGETLLEEVKKYHNSVCFMPSILDTAKECLNQLEPVDVVIAFGSLSYLNEFMTWIQDISLNGEPL